jgi:hypothetical protein
VDYEGYTEDRLTIQGDKMTNEQFCKFLATTFGNYDELALRVDVTEDAEAYWQISP